MKVLLVGRNTSAVLAGNNLQQNDWCISRASSEEDALHFIAAYQFDILITELDLTQGSGKSLVRSVRNKKKPLPILVLAKGIDAPETAELLDMGADDVMTEPNVVVLHARVRAIVRRVNGYHQSMIKVGKLSYDLKNGVLYADGKALSLKGQKRKILELLMLRADRVVTREIMMENCWEADPPKYERTVDNYMLRIRRDISERSKGACKGEDYIQTVWSVGWILKAPAALHQT